LHIERLRVLPAHKGDGVVVAVEEGGIFRLLPEAFLRLVGNPVKRDEKIAELAKFHLRFLRLFLFLYIVRQRQEGRFTRRRDEIRILRGRAGGPGDPSSHPETDNQQQKGSFATHRPTPNNGNCKGK
jgi:hypothetical protein